VKKVIGFLISTLFFLVAVGPSIAASPGCVCAPPLRSATSFIKEIKKLNTLDKDFMKGYSSASEGKHREAIDAFSRCIDRDQYDHAAHYRRGLSYLALNDSYQALLDIEYAMAGVQFSVDERYVLDYKSMDYGKGNNDPNKIDPNKILRMMDKAIQENPKDADAFYNRGTAYLKTGQPKLLDTSINDLSKAIELKPQDLDYHYNRRVALQISDAPPQCYRHPLPDILHMRADMVQHRWNDEVLKASKRAEEVARQESEENNKTEQACSSGDIYRGLKMMDVLKACGQPSLREPRPGGVSDPGVR